jgi:biotin synthase
MGHLQSNLSPSKHDWTRAEIAALYDLSFNELIYRASTVHREHFDPEHIEKAVLLNIKTGACPEDCGYCSQSAHYDTGLERENHACRRSLASRCASQTSGCRAILHGGGVAQSACIGHARVD